MKNLTKAGILGLGVAVGATGMVSAEGIEAVEQDNSNINDVVQSEVNNDVKENFKADQLRKAIRGLAADDFEQMEDVISRYNDLEESDAKDEFERELAPFINKYMELKSETEKEEEDIDEEITALDEERERILGEIDTQLSEAAKLKDYDSSLEQLMNQVNDITNQTDDIYTLGEVLRQLVTRVNNAEGLRQESIVKEEEGKKDKEELERRREMLRNFYNSVKDVEGINIEEALERAKNAIEGNSEREFGAAFEELRVAYERELIRQDEEYKLQEFLKEEAKKFEEVIRAAKESEDKDYILDTILHYNNKLDKQVKQYVSEDLMNQLEDTLYSQSVADKALKMIADDFERRVSEELSNPSIGGLELLIVEFNDVMNKHAKQFVNIDLLEELQGTLKDLKDQAVEEGRLANIIARINNLPSDIEELMDVKSEAYSLIDAFNGLTEEQKRANEDAHRKLMDAVNQLSEIDNVNRIVEIYEGRVTDALKKPSLKELKDLMNEYDEIIDEDIKVFIDDELMIDLFDKIEELENREGIKSEIKAVIDQINGFSNDVAEIIENKDSIYSALEEFNRLHELSREDSEFRELFMRNKDSHKKLINLVDFLREYEIAIKDQGNQEDNEWEDWAKEEEEKKKEEEKKQAEKDLEDAAKEENDNLIKDEEDHSNAWEEWAKEEQAKKDREQAIKDLEDALNKEIEDQKKDEEDHSNAWEDWAKEQEENKGKEEDKDKEENKGKEDKEGDKEEDKGNEDKEEDKSTTDKPTTDRPTTDKEEKPVVNKPTEKPAEKEDDCEEPVEKEDDCQKPVVKEDDCEEVIKEDDCDEVEKEDDCEETIKKDDCEEDEESTSEATLPKTGETGSLNLLGAALVTLGATLRKKFNK